MIDWKISKAEDVWINKIVGRAKREDHSVDAQTLAMDVIATHNGDCKLDLKKLYNAPEFDFWHDIRGIQRHLNRRTGKIEDCFLPRCSKREKAPL